MSEESTKHWHQSWFWRVVVAILAGCIVWVSINGLHIKINADSTFHFLGHLN